MPSFFYYITLREKCQTIVFNKKALDKQGVLAYNKDRKSIPVDGLLPLLELRFNRRELVAGAVISFSCRGDSDYYFYDYSKCTRSRWSNPAESCKSSANHLKWCIDPSYRSPPICSNEQWEQKSEKDLTAYRFRYALKIQYTTLCEKCQTIVFSIKSAAFPGKKALDKCGVLTYNKDRKSTPVDGLLP